MVSLISFNVKGCCRCGSESCYRDCVEGTRNVRSGRTGCSQAYNGVCMERLLQQLETRGTPPGLIKWVIDKNEAFCSNRTATIQVNGQNSEIQSLPQADLPQGSPLSPILYLFFNADLVPVYN